MSDYTYDEAKIRKAYNLRHQANQMLEEAKELLDELNLPLDKKTVGPFLVNVYETRRFNEARAKKVLSKDAIKEVSRMKVDSKLVDALYPELYADCQVVVGKPTIKITLDPDAIEV